MKKKIFYKKTGMYIDWGQLSSLPKIDNFIDIGVGLGTPTLWKKYKNKRVICVDPLNQSENAVKKFFKKGNFSFHKCAVGSKEEIKILNVEKNLGRSTFLNVTKKNFEGKPQFKIKVKTVKLDKLLKQINIKGSCGIKIDVEGFELEVLKGAKKTLKKTNFVIVEARHNHKTFHHQYKLSTLMKLMTKNNFVLTNIFTAKPFIADLCFQPNKYT